MSRLELQDSGVIFRNPLPGHRVINAFYPDLVPLAEDQWLCVLRVGGALYSPDGVLELFRSSDRGATWVREGPILDRSRDSAPHNDIEGRLTVLRDGSLLLRVSRADVSDPQRLMYNDRTQGLVPFLVGTTRSTDGGRTWSDLVMADTQGPFAPSIMPAPYGRILETRPDGSWMLNFETWKSYDNDGPFDLQMYALFSRDEGRSWGEKITVANGSAQGKSFSHGAPIQLEDGRFFISSWCAEPKLQGYFGNYVVTSTDASGRKWNDPVPTGIPGQTSHAADLGQGRLVLVYSHREDTAQPGIKVVRSEDGGRTFDREDPLVVWDAYGKEALGVARTDTYPSSHDAIAYGAPQIVRLDGSRALVSFWCTQGADTHCRWGLVGAG